MPMADEREAMEMAADMGDAAFAFEPAQQTVSGHVTVRFTARRSCVSSRVRARTSTDATGA